jgi:hypothetical protein
MHCTITSFDHLICTREDGLGHLNAKGPGSPEIDG